MMLLNKILAIIALIGLECKAFVLNGDNSEIDSNPSYAKIEKLQIEGTVKNLDEYKLKKLNDKSKLTETDSNDNFNNYWSNLDWGTRTSHKESRQLPGQSKTSSDYIKIGQSHDFVEEREPGSPYKMNTEMLNPDVEFIEPSKISGQLANLKFMRLDKQIKKDI